MNGVLLDGKTLSQNRLTRLQETIQNDISAHKKSPGLSAILVGNDPASKLYIQHKQRAAKKVGIHTTLIHLDEAISQIDLMTHIETLNQDAKTHGILVQLPLPLHIDTNAVITAIAPHKDVDGFHPLNIGSLAQNTPCLHPCTPLGVLTLLQHYNILLTGKHAVVIGTSRIVGKPLALELLNQKCTVTLCHSKTENLSHHVQMADILCVAIGKIDIVQSSWIKPEAVVIDIGMNRDQNNQLVGDLDFATAAKHASFITPVPGGVGPMTIAMLMENTWQAYLNTHHCA